MSDGKAEVPLDAAMMSEEEQQQSVQSYIVRVLAENGAIIDNPVKYISRSLDEARPLLDVVQFVHDDGEDYAPQASDGEEDEYDDMDLDEDDYASDESSICIEEDSDDDEDKLSLIHI